MDEKQEGERTRKGELTRQRILESALLLFGSRGYEETTMREIAAEVGSSPGLTYRYFRSKEELVLGLYQNLCAELEEYAHELAPGSLSERFYAMVARQLELMAPHRAALSALLGSPSILVQMQGCLARARWIFAVMAEKPIWRSFWVRKMHQKSPSARIWRPCSMACTWLWCSSGSSMRASKLGDHTSFSPLYKICSN